MKTGKSLLVQLLIVSGLGLSLVVPEGIAQATNANSSAAPALSQSSIQRIVQEVHHQLVLLPYYGVFDNLAYRISPDGTVTLLGEVVRPTLKSDAENAVKHIEGVEHVDNQIKVLPASPMDDQIRMATYRAIYGDSALNQYALRAVPPIHIVVDNGHVTLEGAVANSMDKQIAETRAKSVPNVFSVSDNLAVDQSGS
jgi:hyperosmotically inducible periplasmic protein